MMIHRSLQLDPQRGEDLTVTPPSTATDKQSLQTIVYIGSVGYSGSTLLDIVLGANQGISSLGEVGKIKSFYQQNERCTCGERVPECPFWKRIETAISQRRGEPFSFADFSMLAETRHRTIHRRLPSLNEAMLVAGAGTLWRAAGLLSRQVKACRLAANNSIELFETVAAIQGTPIVVDSTKEPVKLKSLYLTAPQRFRIVFLVRDGRAVTFSQMKHKGMDFETAARRWNRYMFNLQLMMKTIPRRKVLLVTYENFCRQPHEEFQRICQFAGASNSIDFKTFRLSKQDHHNIGGNPMRRRTEEVEIRLDEHWRDQITADQSAVFEKVAGHMNRKFGYT